jgi:hypothetical protein
MAIGGYSSELDHINSLGAITIAKYGHEMRFGIGFSILGIMSCY